MDENESEQPYIAIVVMLVFVAIGIATLMVAKHIAGIDGDAVFVVLLLIPVFVYLIITGKLDEVRITSRGVSARIMRKSVSNIKDKVTEIGEYEEQRSTYLGKLNQILKNAKMFKKETRFCLIYADVDILRQHSRKIFLEEKKEGRPPDKRRSEDDIRKQIIKKLEFALADAFCEKGIRANKNKKYYIFHLEEPDIVMIARDSNVEEAKTVAERSQEIFKRDTSLQESPEGYTATIAIISSNEDTRPRELDKIALKRLSRGKEHEKGIVYAVTLS